MYNVFWNCIFLRTNHALICLNYPSMFLLCLLVLSDAVTPKCSVIKLRNTVVASDFSKAVVYCCRKLNACYVKSTSCFWSLVLWTTP